MLPSNYKKCSKYLHCKCDTKGKIQQKDCDFHNIGKHVNANGDVILDLVRWSSPTKMRKMC